MLSSAANALVRLLIAPDCVACGRALELPLAGPVCPICWRSVARLTPPLCERCGDALPSAAGGALCSRCSTDPPDFDVARSAGVHDGALREIVHAFKYGARRELAAPLAGLMRVAGHDLLANADVVVPVPLHRWRSLRRGFNQSADLAHELGRPVWHALRRRRHGPPQASLPAARRHANLKGAYAMNRWARVPPRRANPTGLHVVLVDDVMTTGATLEACARVLKAAGVASVSALTVARAVAARPAPRRR